MRCQEAFLFSLYFRVTDTGIHYKQLNYQSWKHEIPGFVWNRIISCAMKQSDWRYHRHCLLKWWIHNHVFWGIKWHWLLSLHHTAFLQNEQWFSTQHINFITVTVSDTYTTFEDYGPCFSLLICYEGVLHYKMNWMISLTIDVSKRVVSRINWSTHTCS